MTTAFYVAITWTMLSRAPILLADQPLSKDKLDRVLFFQLLLFLIAYPLFSMVIFQGIALTSLLIGNYYISNRSLAPIVHILSLVVIIGSALFLFGPEVEGSLLSFQPESGISGVWLKLPILLFGAVLVSTEANSLVRLVLGGSNIKPGQPKSLTTQEYGAGRIIGILERLIAYILVLSGELTAIGFVAAAKGFARFKELNKKKFAEYVLIGTLTSLLLGLLLAKLVEYLLS